MKKMKIILVVAAGLMLYSYAAWAESPSVELGKKLSDNPGLGGSKNVTSCSTCHLNGKGLDNAGANPQLTTMINKCIQGPLKGEALSEKTVAMESLRLYIKSLAKK